MLLSHVKTYPPYYERMYEVISKEISLNDLLKQRKQILQFYESIPDEKWAYRYAEGKWSIQKVVRHILDAELIFDYRALSIVRGEKNKLMGWSENEYADQVNEELLSKESLIQSLRIQLDYTSDLFLQFSSHDLKKIGNANGYDIEVGAIGFCILAHEIHHRNVIKERYLYSYEI